MGWIKWSDKLVARLGIERKEAALILILRRTISDKPPLPSDGFSFGGYTPKICRAMGRFGELLGQPSSNRSKK